VCGWVEGRLAAYLRKGVAASATRLSLCVFRYDRNTPCDIVAGKYPESRV